MKFNLKQNLSALIIFSCIGTFIGCSSSAKPANSADNGKVNTTVENTTADKTDKQAPNTNRDTGETIVASGDKVGVPECDAYIEKYEACVSKNVPEAARQSLKTSFEQTRQTWKNLAANPQTKSSLASACKQSQEAAKQSMSSFHCDF